MKLNPKSMLLKPQHPASLDVPPDLLAFKPSFQPPSRQPHQSPLHRLSPNSSTTPAPNTPKPKALNPTIQSKTTPAQNRPLVRIRAAFGATGAVTLTPRPTRPVRPAPLPATDRL